MAWRAVHALSLLLLIPSRALAENCYYPNGDLSTIDYPCSSDGGACCPLNWRCLSNGLCYLENENYFERHTCTDKNWGSSCPDFCTYNGTAPGNEAILQCDDDTYCCDWNRVSGNCCNKAATSFDLAQGTQIALISATAPRTPATSSAGITSSSTTTTAGTISSTPTSTASQSTTQETTTASSLPTTAQTSTAVMVSTPTSSGASPTTITQVRTLISTPSTTPSSTTSPAPHSLAPIIGPAVGVPLFLALLAPLAFLLIRRRRKAKYAKFNPELFSPETSSAGATDMYAHLGGGDPYKDGRPELDSYPVAETKPINELEGAGAYDARHKTAAGGMGSPQSHGKSASSVSPMAGSTDRWSTVSELQQPAGPQQPTSWTPGNGLGVGSGVRQGQHSSVHPYMRPELQHGQGMGMGMGSVPEDTAPVYRAYQPPHREVAELSGSEVLAVRKEEGGSG
ncbi:hypothetical protein B0A48_12191 [Cryoendolithus antarcticus]|uniref:Mid2 domain-containing protein n=1 Tax=Cryoendolithus antarcticus TaxID=1507870 RepID=A0A1V8SUV9_9PEZI|nr:hypothetical protein B0A48_12191 [Cryoendolithus antarcticus]